MDGKVELVAPPWSDAAIIAAAGRFVASYIDSLAPEYVRTHGIHFDDVYRSYIEPTFKIPLVEYEKLGVDHDGRAILGVYNYFTNVAYLDPALAPEHRDPRRAFTLWHEVAGHGALQGAWLRKHVTFTAAKYINVTEVSLSAAAERRIERQANLFASHVAAPRGFVVSMARKVFRNNGSFLYTGPCDYCLDVNGLPVRRYVASYLDLCTAIARSMNQYFGGLSAEALGYAVAESGLVENRQRSDLRLFRVAGKRAS